MTIIKIMLINSISKSSGKLSTGLGLSLCKEFVEKNRDKIEVESEWGVGSKFVLTLPWKIYLYCTIAKAIFGKADENIKQRRKVIKPN